MHFLPLFTIKTIETPRGATISTRPQYLINIHSANMQQESKSSFIRARDPSILASNVCKPKIQLFKINESGDDDDEAKTEVKSRKLEVILRIKAGSLSNLYDIKDDTLRCTIPSDSHFARYARGDVKTSRVFTVSRILSPTTVQADVFNDIVKPRILNFINGENSNVFAYGTSGSGKTYTMIGTNDDPGLIPRSIEYVFNSLQELSKSPLVTMKHIQKDIKCLHFTDIITDDKLHYRKTYVSEIQPRLSEEVGAILENENIVNVSVWISFAEIYNEQVYDLFDKCSDVNRKKLQVCNNLGHSYIKGLKNVYVANSMEAHDLLLFGLENLRYAATSINSHSSRAHCILTLKLVQQLEAQNEIQCSTFNFCDLAGSERCNKTNNTGDRLKESNNINKSLMTLGKCIGTIRSNQLHGEKKMIPYRESKLTQLFQKTFKGHEDITMIVCINPSLEMFDESVRVLDFTAIAKEIDVQPLDIKKTDRFSLYMNKRNKDEKEEQITHLKSTIAELYKALLNETSSRDRLIKSEKEQLIKRFEGVLKDNMERQTKVVRELQNEIRELNNQLDEVPKKRLRLDSSVVCLDSDEEVCENCIELEKTLEDAKEQHEILVAENNKLMAENIVLKEKIEAQSKNEEEM